MVKIIDDVKEMGMCDLAHNCMFIKNGKVWYRNFSDEMPLHDLMRTLIKYHVKDENEDIENMKDEELSEYITEIYGGYLAGFESIEFVLAAFYHMAWGFAEVRESLKGYEQEQLIEQEREKEIKEIADYYGVDFEGVVGQYDKMIEECAELIQALSKLKYEIYDVGGALDKVSEEIADVQIMIKQLIYLLSCKYEVNKMMEFKINRQLEIIQEEKERKEFCNE